MNVAEITEQTEAEINDADRAGIRALIAEYGHIHRVPFKAQMDHGEKIRRLWEGFVARRDDKPIGPAEKRIPASKLISDYCGANIGLEITAPELADGAGVSVSSAYTYLRDNRSEFQSTDERGVYRIVDTDARRAAAKRDGKRTERPAIRGTTAATETSQPDSADDVATAQRVIDAMAGGTDARVAKP